MKKELLILVFVITLILGVRIEPVSAQTFCNPMNLCYQYDSKQPANRDVDDASVVLYKDNYYLFASKSGGYWHSSDLLSWKFTTNSRLPFENQGPAAFVLGDWLYFATSFSDTIYRSNNPVEGKWEAYTTSVLLSLIGDFTIFVDADQRVYCYYGCTNNDGVMARELDAKDHFNPLGVPMVCKLKNPLAEKKNSKVKSSKTEKPVIKGSWMTKYNGKYYYQRAEQNVDFGSVADVVYVSNKPFGPFVYAENNPFSFRPDGFVSGAGNGSTFADKFGNWWHIATTTNSGKTGANNRLSLFPAGFDKDGVLYTRTDFGDYPMMMPKEKYTEPEKLNPGWSLLSYNKSAKASSGMAVNPESLAFDENIGTYWSAQSGKKGEWLSVDLGSVCTINAIQLNYAAYNLKTIKRDQASANQYLIEFSNDNKTWIKLIDKTTNTEDNPHPYEELKIPVQAQYVKITNYLVPSGNFAISGFRIFGTGSDRKPKKVSSFRGVRDYNEQEITKLFWGKQNDVTGYNIRYGAQNDKLYHSFQVYKSGPLKVRCPDKNKTYWFQIDAFNENGVSPGKAQQSY